MKYLVKTQWYEMRFRSSGVGFMIICVVFSCRGEKTMSILKDKSFFNVICRLFCYLVLKIHNKLENSRVESSNIKSYCLRLRTWFQFNQLLLPPQLWYYQLEIKIMFTFCSQDNLELTVNRQK